MRYSAIFLFVLFSSIAYCQITFERTYDESSLDIGYEVKQTFDGGYIVVGGTYSDSLETSALYLMKADSLGNFTWAKTFGGPPKARGLSVDQTKDSCFIISGLINTPGVTEVYLLKTNKWGDSLWTKHLDYNNGPLAYNDGASVKETNDKGFIITGLRNYAPNWNMHLLKTDSLGNLLWARNYSESTCASQGFSVQLTADNGFVIAGFISDSLNTNDEDFYLVKTDSIGNLLWSKRYGESKRNRAYSVSSTFDKGFIITGIGNWDPSIPSGSIYLVRTDSIGDTVWTKRYGGTAIDEGFSVIQTLDGGFVLTGYTASYGQGSVDVWIIKTNSDGNIEWEKKYGGFRSDIGRSIQQTYDGGFIIAGYTNSFGSESGYDIYLIKTNEIGEMAVNENFLPASEIILYPNPARNKVTIINKSIFSEVLIDIFDICGEKIWGDKFLYQKSIELDVSNLPMGVYILNILTEDGSLTKKLVIN